eukprot:UN25587
MKLELLQKQQRKSIQRDNHKLSDIQHELKNVMKNWSRDKERNENGAQKLNKSTKSWMTYPNHRKMFHTVPLEVKIY